MTTHPSPNVIGEIVPTPAPRDPRRQRPFNKGVQEWVEQVVADDAAFGLNRQDALLRLAIESRENLKFYTDVLALSTQLFYEAGGTSLGPRSRT